MKEYHKDYSGKLIERDVISGQERDITDSLNIFNSLDLVKVPNGAKLDSKTDLVGNTTLSYTQYYQAPLYEPKFDNLTT